MQNNKGKDYSHCSCSGTSDCIKCAYSKDTELPSTFKIKCISSKTSNFIAKRVYNVINSRLQTENTPFELWYSNVDQINRCVSSASFELFEDF